MVRAIRIPDWLARLGDHQPTRMQIVSLLRLVFGAMMSVIAISINNESRNVRSM